MNPEQLRQELARTQAELQALHQEMSQTNSELMALMLEMDDRVAERTRKLVALNAALLEENRIRLQGERQLREQAELLDKANEAIITANLDHRINFWNRGAERLLGWTAQEMKGRLLDEFFTLTSPVGSMPVGNVFKDLRDWRGDLSTRRPTGENLLLETSVTVLREEGGAPTGWLMISVDVTQSRELEEKFLRAQRLESIGMLAAGIAHDLNNAIAPVGIVAALLRNKLKDPKDLRWIDTLEKSVSRSSGLVRQILGFVHGIGGEPKIVQVKHLLREIAEVISQTFPKSVVFEHDIPKDLWTITAQTTQIQQVFLNLCVNARDAMPTGGTLRLRGENRWLDEAAARLVPGTQPGPWLVLRVEDTGSGIPPEVLERIWNPFFTTKPAGQGTGLGLATVRGIVQTHHGVITVKTEVSKGTEFSVYFPAAEVSLETEPESSAASNMCGRGECVLVVDDEEPNRESLHEILTAHGYRAIMAADGAEAVAIVDKPDSEVALVVTDYEMPVLHGEGLTRLIRAHHPNIKILMISGSNRMLDIGCDAKLAKPHSADDLLRAVDQLLHPTVAAGSASAA